MSELCKLIWYAFAGPFSSRAALVAEILVLRHQLNVLRRKSPSRMAFSGLDRAQTGNGGALASGWLPCLLAVEITTARRPADYSIGNLPAHSRDERREPTSLIGRSGSSAFRLSTTSSVERIPRGWNKVHKRGCRHPQSRTSPALIPRLLDLSSVM